VLRKGSEVRLRKIRDSLHAALLRKRNIDVGVMQRISFAFTSTEINSEMELGI
jgi:hypothetical protein